MRSTQIRKGFLLLLTLVGVLTADHSEGTPWSITDAADPTGVCRKSGDVRAGLRIMNGVTVPSDFPEITIHTLKETAPGKIFFASTFTDIGNYLVIMENDGKPYFYRRFPSHYRGSGEFQLQPTGVLTAYLFQPRFFIALDPHYAIVDTFRCRNGYGTDAHELVLLPDGHALMIALDTVYVDMSQYITNGHEHMKVVGNHIQEVDASDSVVFEWKSWDHFNITDAQYLDFQKSPIDYVHMNSIAVDYDGHLIISSRHLCEVSKIDRHTKAFIWRLGGKNNQFTFINDSYEISYQHYARPVPGKPDHYTIWDNGNHRHPNFSRVVEYRINTENRTAEKVWQYPESPPGRHSSMMGNAQRLPNGNTFINWSDWPPLFASEVTPGQDVVFEMEAEGLSSNRVRRYEWEGMLKKPDLIAESRSTGVYLIHNKFGDPDVSHFRIYGDMHAEPSTLLTTSRETFTLLNGIQNHATWYFRVSAVSHTGIESPLSNRVSVDTRFIGAGENVVLNGDFADGSRNWSFFEQNDALANAEVIDGEYRIRISQEGSYVRDIQLSQTDMELVQGHVYRFEFDACAADSRTIDAGVFKNGSPMTNYGKIGSTYLNTKMRRFSYEFVMEDQTDFSAMIAFQCGGNPENVRLDNVILKEVRTTAIDDQQPSPDDFRLYPNFPNPFNSRTTFSYRLAKDSKITITLCTVTGAVVDVVLDRAVTAGLHEIHYDASSLESGLYLLILKTATRVRAIKMMLIK